MESLSALGGLCWEQRNLRVLETLQPPKPLCANGFGIVVLEIQPRRLMDHRIFCEKFIIDSCWGRGVLKRAMEQSSHVAGWVPGNGCHQAAALGLYQELMAGNQVEVKGRK